MQFRSVRNCAKNRTIHRQSGSPLPAGGRYGRNPIGMRFCPPRQDLFNRKTRYFGNRGTLAGQKRVVSRGDLPRSGDYSPVTTRPILENGPVKKVPRSDQKMSHSHQKIKPLQKKILVNVFIPGNPRRIIVCVQAFVSNSNRLSCNEKNLVSADGGKGQ